MVVNIPPEEGTLTNIVISSSNTTLACRSRRERCSRPLCSSQHTVGTPPNHRDELQRSGKSPRHPIPDRSRPRRPIPQDPTACTPPVLRATPAFPPPKRRTSRCRRFRTANRRCSTHELTTAERMPAKWLWQSERSRPAAEAP